MLYLRIYACAGLLALPAPSFGQTAPLFGRLGKEHLPALGPSLRAHALGDVDGDRDLDLVADTGDRFVVLLNDGAARFGEAPAGALPPGLADIAYSALRDVDGDGDLDLMAAGGYLHLLLNDGRGRFADASVTHLGALSVSRGPFLFGDIDGDGDQDLLLYVDSIRPTLALNDGQGRFLAASSALPPSSNRMAAFGDMDGDGDLDLVFGIPGSLFANDGKGVFAEVAGAFPKAFNLTEAVAAGDVDGDGDLDLVLGSRGPEPKYAQLLLNDGLGRFTDATQGRLPSSSYPAAAAILADLDGDGDLDLVLGGSTGALLYLNDGKGFFQDATATSLGATPFYPYPLAGDVDGDGDADLVLGGAGEGSLRLNDGRARFADASARGVPNLFNSPSYRGIGGALLADLDGDGSLDVLTFSTSLFLLANDGRGGFADATARSLPVGPSLPMLASRGDLDGDGSPDLLLATAAIHTLLLNDGRGLFTDATRTNLPVPQKQVAAQDLADVDGDGDLDAVFARGYAQERLYLNDGRGNFVDGTAGRFPPNSGTATFLELADVDGDGDPDLVEIDGERPRLGLNDGKGRFPDAAGWLAPPCTIPVYGFLLADLDRDGDLDLLLRTQRVRMPLYLNDGKGGFAEATATHSPSAVYDVAALEAADVDEDGYPDLLAVVRSGGSSGILLFRNDGTGRFPAPAVAVPVLGTPAGLAAGDLDGDGDLDLLALTTNPPVQRLLNLTRQAQPPLVARLGVAYPVDLYGRPGETALLLAGGRGGYLSLPPLGTLRIDPVGAFLAGGAAVPAGGAARLALHLPNDPALKGAGLWLQPLLVDTGNLAGSRLGNVCLETLGSW